MALIHLRVGKWAVRISFYKSSFLFLAETTTLHV